MSTGVGQKSWLQTLILCGKVRNLSEILEHRQNFFLDIAKMCQIACAVYSCYLFPTSGV